jgi:hypothetical protein
MGNLCCAKEHSFQFFRAVFYKVKLHSLTWSAWGRVECMGPCGHIDRRTDIKLRNFFFFRVYANAPRNENCWCIGRAVCGTRVHVAVIFVKSCYRFWSYNYARKWLPGEETCDTGRVFLLSISRFPSHVTVFLEVSRPKLCCIHLCYIGHVHHTVGIQPAARGHLCKLTINITQFLSIPRIVFMYKPCMFITYYLYRARGGVVVKALGY